MPSDKREQVTSEIVMTAKELIRKADKLSGVHLGMTSEEIRTALQAWTPKVDRGYAKKPEFRPIKSGTSDAQKRYIARKQATRDRVRAYRARKAAQDG